jgi:hypothetical protein
MLGGCCAATAGGRLLRDALVRFRSGDGFSHARAWGLQLCLGAVPLLIALNGLASKLWGAATGWSGGGRHRAGPDAGGE